MKRKTKTALKMMSSLVERFGKQEDGITENDMTYSLIYLYKAYGHFVMEEYDQSLKDYLKANSIKKLNLSGQYNM